MCVRLNMPKNTTEVCSTEGVKYDCMYKVDLINREIHHFINSLTAQVLKLDIFCHIFSLNY